MWLHETKRLLGDLNRRVDKLGGGGQTAFGWGCANRSRARLSRRQGETACALFHWFS